MSNVRFIAALLGGTIISGFWGYGALAADVAGGKTDLPAVSAVNGKLEAGGGYADLDGVNGDGVWYGAGSISVPLGFSFGAQADFSVGNAFDETGVGGALHLFTRDPNSHLFGLIGGYSDVGNGHLAFVGGEAEWYLDNISIETAAGYLNANPDSGSSKDRFFAFGDLAMYATDNFRLSVGASSVAQFESANVQAEYLLDSMPVSFKLRGTIGEDGYVAATAGVSFYFGGDDANKSLIRRHREDDPRNRSLDIFGTGAGAAALGLGPKCSPAQLNDPESACYVYNPG
ncbi:hypothetical protein [Aestuariivirga sp.]|uniref:hypothetical protein n=1 Tax=Aestuariivirga sp. TaxID=2650926 RepID=UPI0039E694B1